MSLGDEGGDGAAEGERMSCEGGVVGLRRLERGAGGVRRRRGNSALAKGECSR